MPRHFRVAFAKAVAGIYSHQPRHIERDDVVPINARTRQEKLIFQLILPRTIQCMSCTFEIMCSVLM